MKSGPINRINLLLLEGVGTGDIKSSLAKSKDHSFSVYRAQNKSELSQFKKQSFDAILIDFAFVGRRLDDIKIVSSEFPRTPVIVIANADDEYAARQELLKVVQDVLIKERLSTDLLARSITYAARMKEFAVENAALHSERERLISTITQLENSGTSSGLPDESMLIGRMELEQARADRQKNKFALFRLALLTGGGHDRYSEAAEPMIRQAGIRLKGLLRKSDMVAWGREPALSILATDIGEARQTADIARNILHSFRVPLDINSRPVMFKTAIGISLYPDDGRDPGLLIQNAKLALAKAIESGGGGMQFSDAVLNDSVLQKLKLDEELRSSLNAGDLVVHYQPLVDIATRRIVCAEALIRWHHPERGLLSPPDFMAAASAGLISAVDEWVLRKVCTQARSWMNRLLHPICVTVNLSHRQLHATGFIDRVSKVLAETGLPADCVFFEITEKTAMNDQEQTPARLRELASLGVHLSIDDFGTGYSSLNQLERLPVKRLKIDKSLVRRIPGDPDHRMVIRSITSLAHTMRIKVVAEGVETEDQFRFLRHTGCDEMQGFFFSKPVPPEAFEMMLREAAA